MSAVALMLPAAKQVASGTARSTASVSLSSSLIQSQQKESGMSFTSKPGVSMAPDEQEIVGAVVSALRVDPRSDKQLARDTGHQPRTIKAWREGENVPHLRQFFRLCMELPELRARALRWLESERNLDPDHERATMELLRAAQQVLERRQKRLEEA